MVRCIASRAREAVLSALAIVVFLGGTVRADFAFGTPTNLGPTANSSAGDEEPGISSDGLSIYYCSRRSGGYGGYDMWVTNRATTQDAWGPPVNLGATVNSSSDDFSEDISADGLELYFGSNRPGGSGSYDIWVAKRATTQDDWTPPENLGPMVNSSSQEGCPAISDDGLELYFWSTRPGGAGSYDIWVSRRTATQDDWGMAENLGPIRNSPANDLCTDVSPDGLLLILVSARSGSYGGNLGDLWMVRRPATSEPWGLPVNLGPTMNSSYNENGPCLSADGSTLYFSSDRPGGSGGQDMWQVSIRAVVDVNGDGKVDGLDILRMADGWGTDDTLYDSGPMPWGDGIVDVQDLIALADHIGEDVEDPTLVAHWALDEAEGDIAYDNAYENDAVVVGGAIWRPEGGVIGGSIELDGV
ncbi:MAG: hypothetical protein ACYTAS_08010, partial [Planctomycetota bacterium]